MSKVIKKDKIYLVKSKYGTYTFNNRKTAEELNKHLTNYETISQQCQQTEQTLDRVQKTIISLQMSVSIISDELQRLHEEIL